MPFQPVVNAAMCELIFAMHGSRIQNTLFYSDRAPLALTEMTDLAGALIAWWTANLMPHVSADVQLLQVEVTDLTIAEAPSITVVAPAGLFGEGAADALPASSALCVSFRTGGRGRSSRGRNYVSGIPEGMHSGGVINSTWAESIRSGYEDALSLAVGSSTFSLSVVSRFSGGVPRDPATVTPITAVVLADLYIDHQRRRAPGRGQ